MTDQTTNDLMAKLDAAWPPYRLAMAFFLLAAATLMASMVIGFSPNWSAIPGGLGIASGLYMIWKSA